MRPENRETCVALAGRGGPGLAGLNRPQTLVSLLVDRLAAVSVPGRPGVSDPEVVASQHNNMMMHEVNGPCASALAREYQPGIASTYIS